MKTILVLISVFFFNIGKSYSQANYIIVYDTYQIPDTTQPTVVREELMALHISNNGSEYFSETDRIQKEKIQRIMDEAEVTGNTNLNYGLIKKVNKDKIYFLSTNNTISHKFYTLKNFKNNEYLITNEIPTIRWTMQTKTKKIGNYTCQLATGSINGEVYEAWFTTDIPVPYGPWILHGLPGLILEANNPTGTKKYIFKEIKTLKPGMPVALPKNAIATNRKDFDKMVQASSRSNQQRASDAGIEVRKSN